MIKRHWRTCWPKTSEGVDRGLEDIHWMEIVQLQWYQSAFAQFLLSILSTIDILLNLEQVILLMLAISCFYSYM